jgi:hypothetical protein
MKAAPGEHQVGFGGLAGAIQLALVPMSCGTSVGLHVEVGGTPW